MPWVQLLQYTVERLWQLGKRFWQLGKQNKRSSPLLALSPAEVVETQWVSAQSVCAHTESACLHQTHKIWCTFTLPPEHKWIRWVHAEDSVPHIEISHYYPPCQSTSGSSGTPSFAKRIAAQEIQISMWNIDKWFYEYRYWNRCVWPGVSSRASGQNDKKSYMIDDVSTAEFAHLHQISRWHTRRRESGNAWEEGENRLSLWLSCYTHTHSLTHTHSHSHTITHTQPQVDLVDIAAPSVLQLQPRRHSHTGSLNYCACWTYEGFLVSSYRPETIMIE